MGLKLREVLRPRKKDLRIREALRPRKNRLLK